MPILSIARCHLLSDVDGAAIRRVAERLLSGRPTLTALGPVPDIGEFAELAEAAGC